MNFILRKTVLRHGLIFQQVLLACTYNNDTITTLKKKSTLQISIKVYTHNKLTVQAKVIDMALELSRLSVTK